MRCPQQVPSAALQEPKIEAASGDHKDTRLLKVCYGIQQQFVWDWMMVYLQFFKIRLLSITRNLLYETPCYW